jgi:hypothetical protein
MADAAEQGSEAIHEAATPVRLPGGITETSLREAVAAARSWRAVLRHLGLSAAKRPRAAGRV